MTIKSHFLVCLKIHPITLLALIWLITFNLKAQSIHINYNDGTNVSYNLQDIRKVTYNLDLMNLCFLDGSIRSFNVSTISNYEYTENVGINEIQAQMNFSQVNVFPNPTTSKLNIEYNLNKEDQIQLLLYDIQGNCILKKNSEKQFSGLHHFVFDLCDLPSGHYEVCLQGRSNIIKKNIIKQ